MTINIETLELDQVTAEDLEQLLFDDWKCLHEKNPRQFNLYQKLILEHQINLAPESSKQRLRGLLFQMQGEARRARTPFSHSLRLSTLLMEKFEEMRVYLQHLRPVESNASAEVIEFTPE